MLHDPVIVHIFGQILKKWKHLHKFSMCKDYDSPTVYQNAFKMEEEGHSPCNLKKKPKVGLDQGWTLFEKGTKTTSQLHVPKFEIVSFSNKIHKTVTFCL